MLLYRPHCGFELLSEVVQMRAVFLAGARPVLGCNSAMSSFQKVSNLDAQFALEPVAIKLLNRSGISNVIRHASQFQGAFVHLRLRFGYPVVVG